MNIRSVSNPLLQSEIKRAEDAKGVRMGESHQDRDSNGQREQEEPDKRPLTEEEIQKVGEYFENLTGFKANGLSFELENSESQIRIYIIRDPSGQVVRRIPEFEMRLLIQDKDRKSGQLFDKAG